MVLASTRDHREREIDDASPTHDDHRPGDCCRPDDWAHIDAATKQYDGYKVQAVLNELGGRDHSGRTEVGTPAILGMNFQALSVAQKSVSTPTTLIKHADGTYTAPARRRPAATAG